MSKVHSPQESLATPKPEKEIIRPSQTPAQPAGTGRVFKFSFKSIPVVDAKMQARLEAAARKPRKDRRFPVMIDPPDA